MFSNTNELNDMIDEFVHKYGSIFQDIVKNSMRNDIQKIVDETKKEVRESLHQNYTNEREDDTKMIDEDYESENESSTNDWIFEPTNGFSRGW